MVGPIKGVLSGVWVFHVFDYLLSSIYSAHLHRPKWAEVETKTGTSTRVKNANIKYECSVEIEECQHTHTHTGTQTRTPLRTPCSHKSHTISAPEFPMPTTSTWCPAYKAPVQYCDECTIGPEKSLCPGNSGTRGFVNIPLATTRARHLSRGGHLSTANRKEQPHRCELGWQNFV